MKIVSNEAQLYSSALVEMYVPSRTNVRSTKSDVLILKGTNTKTTAKNYEWRGFRVFALFLWNNLPIFIRQTESIFYFLNILMTPFWLNILGKRRFFTIVSAFNF